jgi:fermentation-respiration switch protein FrsA (DUF1100 family)
MYDRTVKYVRRVLVALTVLVLVGWVGAVGLLWANESRFVYRTSWTRAWSNFDAPFTPLRLASSDGLQLDAVTLEHPSDTREDTRYWVLYFNGAAGSIYRSRYQAHLQQLHATGYNVMSFDYRGFGRNPGTPSEDGLYADAAAAFDYLTRTRGVDGGRVILAGRSLGSAVAVELATRVASAGVLLLSPIDSVPSVGARLYPWAPVRLLASNQFDSLAKIDRVKTPVLIVHALNDRFVPIDAGRSLYAKASGVKRMLETGGGHNSAGFSPFDELGAAMSEIWPLSLSVALD